MHTVTRWSAQLLRWSFALIVACCLFFPASAWADPVAGKVLPAQQPDGTVVQVKVWGDEFYRVMESLDGYTLIRDPGTGVLCYAKLAADGGSLLSTGVKAGSADPAALGLAKSVRIKKAVADQMAAQARAAWGAPMKAPPAQPTVGLKRGICLMIQFPETPSAFSKQQVSDFLNKDGYIGFGNNGSVKQFYSDVSNGKLTFTNDVFGPYTAKHPRSYYDRNESAPYGAAELIVEALQGLEGQIGNFSQYDVDGDGSIDILSVFYAGTRPADNNYALWPHKWYVWAGGYSYTSPDGIDAGVYQICDMGSSLQLGTFCHECGHMLCDFDDYYDTSYQSNGLGNWCLMSFEGSNECNPTPPQPYLRWKAGWLTPFEATPETTSLPCDMTTVMKFTNLSNAQEYFMVTAIQKAGRFSNLPGAGLAIFHIDERGHNYQPDRLPSSHFESSLEQADGLFELEASFGTSAGNAGDLFSQSTHSSFTDTTASVNAKWWDGSNSEFSISSIGASGGSTITFTMGQMGYPGVNSISPASGYNTGGTLVTITGSNLVTGATVQFGGLPATDVTVASATTLTCRTPAHAIGLADVAVTNPNTRQTVKSGAFNYTDPTPVITSALTAEATTSVAFSYQITATNSPVSFGAVGLPAGLTVDSAGLISGIPVAVGNYPVVISATNAGGTGSATLILTVVYPTPPVITSPLAASAIMGRAFTYTLTASGTKPIAFEAVGLPAGLSINSATGVISGTPAVAGVVSVTLKAVNFLGSDTRILTLAVSEPLAPVITSGPSAQNNPVYAGETIWFSISAVGTADDILTYVWNFGDGTAATGPSVLHTFNSSGVFVVSCVVSNNHSGVTLKTLPVTVFSLSSIPGGTGTGGTGGTGGSGTPTAKKLLVTRLQGGVSYAGGGRDAVSLSGVLTDLPAASNMGGTAVSVDIGGASNVFTLDLKGKSVSGQSFVSVKSRVTRIAAVSAKLAGGSWAGMWADEGLKPGAVRGAVLYMPVTLTLGTTVYADTVPVRYSAAGAAGGKFRK